MKRISCSKRIHGWLNTGRQKSFISPEAPDSHKCPRCQHPLETQAHVLMCPHASAHKKRYELLLPMKRKMLTVHGCKVQELFVKCFEAWLANPETPITPDISTVPLEQRHLLAIAIEEQQSIGWDMMIRGYLSRHWAKAVGANPRMCVTDDNGKQRDPVVVGNNWARKVTVQLWEFAREMWHDRNTRLHDPKSDESRVIKGAEVNAEIERLYENIDSYAAQDRWRFDVPLALRLRKPFRARRRWLLLTKLLVEKSTTNDTQGQRRLTNYYEIVESLRNRNPARELESRPTPSPSYVQTTLFGRRPQDPESRSR